MLEDAPQPDSHLRILHESGGTSWVEDNYFHGVPELAAEICRSSSSYDLHQKKELYQAAGVKEYLTVLLEERSVRWHRLVARQYQLLPVNPDGVICSTVFPSLWLDPTGLLAGNMPRVLEVLDRGLKSPDHAEFVRQLAKR
jgi:Uma2 family endonuclease